MNTDYEPVLGDPIPHSITVSDSSERIWQVISMPGNLEYFHPFCERISVDIWPGTGSRDRIFYYNGLVLTREFDKWIDGEGYDLTASAEDGLSFRVYWRIQEEIDEKSSLNITIRQVLDQVDERKARLFTRLLAKYLQQVGQGFEFYLRTGEKVSRNQFGSHRLFSAPMEAD